MEGQTHCSVRRWKTQWNGEPTEMSTALGNCTFKASVRQQLPLTCRPNLFPYPSRCSSARPTRVAVNHKEGQSNGCATCVRPTRCLNLITSLVRGQHAAEDTALAFQSNSGTFYPALEARSVRGPVPRTVKSQKKVEWRFWCNNKVMNASRI